MLLFVFDFVIPVIGAVLALLVLDSHLFIFVFLGFLLFGFVLLGCVFCYCFCSVYVLPIVLIVLIVLVVLGVLAVLVIDCVLVPECVARVPILVWRSCVRSTLRIPFQWSVAVHNRSQSFV